MALTLDEGVQLRSDELLVAWDAGPTPAGSGSRASISRPARRSPEVWLALLASYSG